MFPVFLFISISPLPHVRRVPHKSFLIPFYVTQSGLLRVMYNKKVWNTWAWTSWSLPNLNAPARTKPQSSAYAYIFQYRRCLEGPRYQEMTQQSEVWTFLDGLDCEIETMLFGLPKEMESLGRLGHSWTWLLKLRDRSASSSFYKIQLWNTVSSSSWLDTWVTLFWTVGYGCCFGWWWRYPL